MDKILLLKDTLEVLRLSATGYEDDWAAKLAVGWMVQPPPIPSLTPLAKLRVLELYEILLELSTKEAIVSTSDEASIPRQLERDYALTDLPRCLEELNFTHVSYDVDENSAARFLKILCSQKQISLYYGRSTSFTYEMKMVAATTTR